MTTRASATESACAPPPLVRMSAYRKIVFTKKGRSLARRLLLPSDEQCEYYFVSVSPGTSKHFLVFPGETRLVTGELVGLLSDPR